MADLKFQQKLLFEKIFDRGGYVLDFTNRTFNDFFSDFNIDIYSEKYEVYGYSKMKRLRAFWEIESNKTVVKVLNALIEYAESIGEIDPKDKHLALAYTKQLLDETASPSNNEKGISEEDFLKKDFEKINLDLLNLGSYTEAIEQRIQEIQGCLNIGAPLATIFLCGSTLEGVLLNIATNNPKDFNTTKTAPKDKNNKVKMLHSWTLSELIDTAYELNFLGLNTKKFSHALRDFRNFIHPYEQQSKNFNPDMHTAKICWQVVQSVFDDLSKNEAKRK